MATAATKLLEMTRALPEAHTLGRDPDEFAKVVHALATDRTGLTGHTFLDDEVAPLLDDVFLPAADPRAPLDAFVSDRK